MVSLSFILLLGIQLLLPRPSPPTSTKGGMGEKGELLLGDDPSERVKGGRPHGCAKEILQQPNGWHNPIVNARIIVHPPFREGTLL